MLRRSLVHPKPSEIVPDDGTVTLACKPGVGKIADCGYDQAICLYTTIPADADFTLSATIDVQSFAQSGIFTSQEGFGLFVRDTMDSDPLTGLFYSNMIAVGGTLGRGNVFGRHGVTADDIENVHNVILRRPLSDTAELVATPDKPLRCTLTLKRQGNLFTVSMIGKHGKDLLADESVPRKSLSLLFKDKHHTLDVPAGAFSARDPQHQHVGFMVARGSSISVDTSSVRLAVEESASPEALLDMHNPPKDDKSEIEQDLQPSTVPNSHSSDAGRQLATVDPEAKNVFAAPWGIPSGSGSAHEPLDLQTALDASLPHQGILLLPGAYKFTDNVIIRKGNEGIASCPRHLCPAPNEGSGTASPHKPWEENPDSVVVLDFDDTDHGLIVKGAHWEIGGLIVTKGLGIQIQGCHNLVKNCMTIANRETGILIRHEDNASPHESWPAYNTIENCVSCRNHDPSGENADGFACKVTAGEGNRFIGCVSYLNSDDGFDLFSKNRRIGKVELLECEAYLNGFQNKPTQKDEEKSDKQAAAEAEENTAPIPREARWETPSLKLAAGNGNGFKLGGSGLPVGHRAISCAAAGNKGAGFTSNSNPLLFLKGCASHDNHGPNIRYYFYGPEAPFERHLEDCVFSASFDFDKEMLLRELTRRYESNLPVGLTQSSSID